MKRLSAVLLAIAVCVPATTWAFGLSYGVRAGAGLAFVNEDAGRLGGPDTTPDDLVSLSAPFAVGLGINLDLALLDIEVDALYWHHAYSYDFPAPFGSQDGTEGRLALPVLVRVGIPLVPLLSLGAGLEPRFLISADSDIPLGKGKEYEDTFEAMVLYLPILLGVDLDLSVIELRVEARFELQLTNHLSSDVKNPDDQRIHEGMLFAGVFF